MTVRTSADDLGSRGPRREDVTYKRGDRKFKVKGDTIIALVIALISVGLIWSKYG